MLYVIILILSSLFMECENQEMKSWCPLIKPNVPYNGLGIYRRFLDDSGNSDLVMFNRAGSEWLFTLTVRENHYHINLVPDSVKKVEDKGVVNRFATFEKSKGYKDCTVKTTVKDLILILSLIFSLFHIRGAMVMKRYALLPKERLPTRRLSILRIH